MHVVSKQTVQNIPVCPKKQFVPIKESTLIFVTKL
jgi:hypothetical protein